jgi:EAL domain-containing protein (putative c-di-GMP-specific phosphodiesterase class I)
MPVELTSADSVADAAVVTWSLDGFGDETIPCRQQVVLNTFPFRIGRKSGLPLTLPSPTISKVHAEILREENQLWLHDLKSTNGTFLNGHRLEDRMRLKPDDLVQFADIESRLTCQCSAEPRNSVLATYHLQYSTVLQFRQILETGDVVPHFQPVVNLATGGVVGYEALARSNFEGLRTASELFQTAMRLGKEAELSELCRRESLRQGTALPGRATLFVNTHPAEIGDPALLTSLRELRAKYSDTSLVLEIHERSACDIAAMRELRVLLGELNIGLAYDDFGNGQSRLVELMEVPPDYVKFDMALIRDIHKASPHKQKTLETLVKMVRNPGVAPLAEGIESHDESAVCTDMGFLFAQGFLFGKPTLATCLVAEHVEEQFGSPAHTLPHGAASESVWVEQRFGDSQATPWQVHVG